MPGRSAVAEREFLIKTFGEGLGGDVFNLICSAI
jgi:hypothetical protein